MEQSEREQQAGEELEARVAVVGSYVQDLAWNTATFPAPGETRIGQFRTGPGGKGFNQAVACQRQGVSTLFVGAVGDDIFGRGVADFAEREGLRAELEVVADEATGTASIVVNNQAENLIVVALGANNVLRPEQVEKFRAEISEANILVCQLECSLAATQKALEIAREEGVLTILNPAPINAGVTRELLELADIVTPNETEFVYLMQTLFGETVAEDFWNENDENLNALCQKLGVPTVVLTLGKNGSFVSHNAQLGGRLETEFGIGDSAAYYRIKPIKVGVVDTTGAGDAFNGGLAAGLVQFPDEFMRAVRYATVVAGLACTRSGTAPAMPRQAEAAERFKELCAESESVDKEQ